MKTIYEVRIGKDTSRMWACKTKEKADEIAKKISDHGFGIPEIRVVEYDPESPFAQIIERGMFVETEELMGRTNWLLNCRMYV